MSKQTCDGDSIPRTCSDAFGDIKGMLGTIKAEVEATHEQTAKTNGHVEDLFKRMHQRELAAANFADRIKSLENRLKRYYSWVARVLIFTYRVALTGLAGLLSWKHLKP